MIGWNGRMDGIQGAILSVKLKYLDNWNNARRKNAQLYANSWKPSMGATPREMDYARHIYHVYAVKAKNRDSLMAALSDKGISCGIHYPVPIHLQNAYKYMGAVKGSFPVAETCAEEIVSLPCFLN